MSWSRLILVIILILPNIVHYLWRLWLKITECCGHFPHFANTTLPSDSFLVVSMLAQNRTWFQFKRRNMWTIPILLNNLIHKKIILQIPPQLIQSFLFLFLFKIFRLLYRRNLWANLTQLLFSFFWCFYLWLFLLLFLRFSRWRNWCKIFIGLLHWWDLLFVEGEILVLSCLRFYNGFWF